jgi:glycosyltransferase involved in cell wall biosynthesis
MKILLGNNRLAKPGGSETYAYAMAAELMRQGHKVTCIASGKPGMVSAKLRELGVAIYFRPIPGERFDVAFLSHSTSIAFAQRVKAFKVQTCHGIFPSLEQPVDGMDAYVAITEEVCLHLRKLGYRSTVIHNGIDCNRFQPEKRLHRELTTVLSLAHGEGANVILSKVCADLGVQLITQNKYNGAIWHVEHLINKADLVVGLGRSVYEAIACGRNAVIYDQRSYMDSAVGDGFVDCRTIGHFLKNNCTGRYSQRVLFEDDVKLELSKYNPMVGKLLRKYALEELNIEKQVKKYLALVR